MRNLYLTSLVYVGHKLVDDLKSHKTVRRETIRSHKPFIPIVYDAPVPALTLLVFYSTIPVRQHYVAFYESCIACNKSM